MAKIKTVSRAKQQLLAHAREEWMAAGLSTAPAAREEAAEAVRGMYVEIGQPRPLVFWMESPWRAALAAAMLNRALRRLARARVGDELGQQLDQQLGQQLYLDHHQRLVLGDGPQLDPGARRLTATLLAARAAGHADAESRRGVELRGAGGALCAAGGDVRLLDRMRASGDPRVQEADRLVRAYEFSDLSTYNAERARGLIHTPEWQAKMAAEQGRFNAAQAAKLTALGYVKLGDSWISPGT